jgi:hypothetical protein
MQLTFVVVESMHNLERPITGVTTSLEACEDLVAGMECVVRAYCATSQK